MAIEMEPDAVGDPFVLGDVLMWDRQSGSRLPQWCSVGAIVLVSHVLEAGFVLFSVVHWPARHGDEATLVALDPDHMGG